MSGNYDKPVTIPEMLDAISDELQSIHGKLKTLEEVKHTQREVVQPPKNKFVLRHVFKLSELKNCVADESCYEEHYDASWCISVYKSGDFLAAWLRCIVPENKTDWSVEVSEDILINPNGESARKSGGRYCFTKSMNFGWRKFIDLESLEKDHAVKGEFVVEIHVTVIKTTGIHEQILRSFDDKDLSDVALLVNEKKFYVSKLFLASQSNYFKALFLGNFEESKKSEVKLRGVDENDLQKFLEVLYGENAIDDITVDGVLFLADMYGSSLATEKCVSFLMKDSKKSLENKLILAGKYNLEELKQQCLDKITTKEHIRSVLHGRHDMHQSILAVLLEKSLSLK
ncbi:unnamed protein product [Caenorhabditis brenneri]